MPETDSLKYVRVALLSVGVIFVVGIYPLTIIWPSGWSWHTGQSAYLQMILGIYATVVRQKTVRTPSAPLAVTRIDRQRAFSTRTRSDLARGTSEQTPLTPGAASIAAGVTSSAYAA
jgi:hypothetical protein